MIIEKTVVGHQDQLKILHRNYEKKFPHAWIFNGIKGIGKYTTAINFINNVNKKKIGSAQNFFEINSQENLASIDDVRNLINQINLTNANENQKCFIVIDNSDYLNFNSYNALLKTIEEPPSNTVIILICHNINKIPKTILSRCIKLEFKPLNKKQITLFCDNNNINYEGYNLEENYYFINGSIEKLYHFISEEGKVVREFFKKHTLDRKMKHSEFEAFYEQVNKNYEKYFSIIINYLFLIQKKRYVKYHDTKLFLRKILIFFSNIELFTKQNLNIDKKKELHYLLSEFFKTLNYE